MIYLRSLLFALGQWLTVPLFSLAALFTFPFSLLTRYRVVSLWAKSMTYWLRFTCNLDYRVLGAEHIPDEPVVILSKHQSAWETIAFQKILPPHVWVLKRELLLLPFFGWGLAMLKPVAIDRNAGRQALKQVVEQGRARLAEGMSVLVFPEGTRIPPGQKGHYQIGGAWLATHAHVKALPVAHNAGEFWGKNGFVKRPGTITVMIGEPIDTHGMKADELNRWVEAWIEDQMATLAGSRAA
ncbi:MAG: lysophospholipid acyltransferase family protein [Burkholderiales bacterium]